MIILGINAYHGDSSACLLKNGQIICAIEEERIRRIKHWAGFPIESIKWCLDYSGVSIKDVNYIAVSRNPLSKLHKKLLRLITKAPSINFIRDRFSNLQKIKDIKSIISEQMEIQSDELQAKLVNVEHHRAHLASAYYVSGFNKSACISVDGFGDFLSVMKGEGSGDNISIIDSVEYPHSLGIFYTALTQFLGFRNYGDEYKLMGLSAYGKPTFFNELSQILELKDNGLFKLNTEYFLHDSNGVEMTWNNGSPDIDIIYSDKMVELLGEPRGRGEDITEKHKNLAASVQSVYEHTFFHMLNDLYEKTQNVNICLAGGCVQNSLANGKILNNTDFKNIFIPPSAHDGGTSIGAALWVWHNHLKENSNYKEISSPYLGPEYENDYIQNYLNSNNIEFSYLEDQSLFKEVSKLISQGNVVGWFQGRSEWGPRALGNRSILCDPRNPNMQNIINSKIKRRESFRPFAPSILYEYVGDWFKHSHPVNYMEMVYEINDDKIGRIPAVTHVDGTGRLQTVTKELNPRYYNLIKEFFNLTEVPILLNTSFNENEPIVNSPDQAVECFLRTDMDALVLNNYLVRR